MGALGVTGSIGVGRPPGRTGRSPITLCLAMILLNLHAGSGTAHAQGTPAQEAAKAVVDKQGPSCGVSFTGFPPFGGTSDPPVTVFTDVGGGGYLGGAEWFVDTDLKPLPYDPTAGELVRGCSGKGGKPKTASDWRSLPYFDGNQLELGTSERWNGAREVSSPPSKIEQTSRIWDKDCSKKKQKVRFSRRFFAPGPPNGKPFVVVADYMPTDTAYRVVQWVQVKVNGKKVGRWKFSGSGRDLSGKQFGKKVIEYGGNSMVVIAKKRKAACQQPTGLRARDERGRKQANFGFSAELNASFLTDLKTSDKPLSNSGDTGTYQHQIVVKNSGPSGVFSGEISFDLSAFSHDGWLATIDERPSNAECSAERFLGASGVDDGEIVCTFKNLERRKRAKFVLGLLAKTDDDGKATVFVQWDATPNGMGDIVFDNDRGTASVTYCNPGKTDCSLGRGNESSGAGPTLLSP